MELRYRSGVLRAPTEVLRWLSVGSLLKIRGTKAFHFNFASGLTFGQAVLQARSTLAAVHERGDTSEKGGLLTCVL